MKARQHRGDRPDHDAIHLSRAGICAAAACLMWMGACSSAESPSAYPPGPYGVDVGDTLENLVFADLDGEPFEIGRVRDGRRRALLLYATGTWCFSCRPESEWLNGKIESGDTRVLPVAVVLEDNRHERADARAAERWAEALEAKFQTLVDPNGSLDAFRTSGIVPMNLVIDTRTMRIVYRQYEFDPKALDEALATITEDDAS